LFGSDLEDSDEEEKATKPPKRSERDAQMNELFGDDPVKEKRRVKVAVCVILSPTKKKRKAVKREKKEKTRFKKERMVITRKIMK